MADLKFKHRQFTIYLPSAEDLDRWRKLAPPYALNRWVYLMVEKALEGEQQRQTRTTIDTDALRKEVVDLRKENESLAAKLDHIRSKEVEDILERSSNSPMQLDRHVVDLLRSGGCWSSARLIKKLSQQPENNVVVFERKYIDVEDSTTTITPEFFSNINDNISLEVDAKSVERTLDALEQIGLVVKLWNGWKWNNK
ncbi:MAG: hypothetical protein ABR985_21645 [Methanotrichaceae archaeon]|jgi:hypothetical protein